MSARPTQKPEVRQATMGKCEPHDVYTHPAFGVVGISVTSGGENVLFGSDLPHNSRVTLTIKRAELARNLSNDWVHPREALIEVDMSHHQFSEMITSPNRGEGTPCTIRHINYEMVPGIERIETASDTLQKEIKDSARRCTEQVRESLAEIGKMIESGSISKTKLRELHKHATWAADGFGNNVNFVVEQGIEAMEKAAVSVKMDIEATVSHYVRQLGVEAAKEIGLSTGDAPPSIEHTIEVNPNTKRLTRPRK